MKMSETGRTEKVRERDKKIGFLLVVASFIFFVGTVVYKDIEKNKAGNEEKEKKYTIEDEMDKLEKESLGDMEIDKILVEAKAKAEVNSGEAEKMFERIGDYRGEASCYLGKYNYDRGNIAMAEKKLLKAVQLGNADALYFLGELYSGKGNYREAEKWFLKAEQQGIQGSIERLEEMYNRLGEKDKRKEKLEILSNRKMTAYMYELGKVYIREGKYREAEEIFVKLTEYDVIKAKSRISDIREILKNENNEKTVEDKIRGLEEKIVKKDIDMIFREARKLYFINPEKAIGYLEKIEKHKPEAAAYLAEYYSDHFDRENTLKWLKNAVERGEVSSMYDLGNFYVEEGRYEEAEKWYQEALKKKYMRSLFKIGEIYEKQGNRKEAEKWYRRAVEKGDRGGMERLSAIYMDEGRYEEAEDLLIKSSETGNFAAMFKLANKYYSEGKYGEAEKIYMELYRLGDSGSMVFIGEVKELQKDYEGAEKWYLKSAESGNYKGMYKLAILYDRIKGGKYKERAVEWYQRAAGSGHGISMYNLAEIYKNDFNDLGLAQKWYMKALKSGRMDARDRLKEIKNKG